MRAFPDLNFPKFHAVATSWRKDGWNVINPAESFDGKTDLPLHVYMQNDIRNLLDHVGAIAFIMDKLHLSENAYVEFLIARSLAYPMFDAESKELIHDRHLLERIWPVHPALLV